MKEKHSQTPFANISVSMKIIIMTNKKKNNNKREEKKENKCVHNAYKNKKRKYKRSGKKKQNKSVIYTQRSFQCFVFCHKTSFSLF